jgi:uncharacterized protein
MNGWEGNAATVTSRSAATSRSLAPRAPVSSAPIAAGDAGRPTDEPVRHTPLAWLLLKLVALYRATAAFRAPRCRFHPSCSSYAVVAIERHGARRGSWLAVRRLGRCHPWNPGGVDHVPPRK